MNITELAHKNRITFFVLMTILLLSGISTFNELPRDDMPPFLIRNVNIVTRFPGASPERVEQLITDKIEEKVQEIPEIDYISSESRTGISIVTAVIKDSEFHLQPIFDRIRRKVEEAERELPNGSRVPEVNDELGDVFGIIIGLTAEGYSYAEMKDVADEIRDGFIKLPNAAKVEIHGDQEERFFIDYDNTKLTEVGLTKAKLQSILSSKNILFPGGKFRTSSENIIVEPTGNLETIKDLQDLIVGADDAGHVVYLGDVTRIYRDYIQPPEGIVRINGEQGLTIAVNLKKGGNIIQLGEEIDELVEHYMSIYPIGIDLMRVASQDTEVEKSVNDFLDNLIQAVLVVLAVMLLFLGFRTGMIVASLIPMTIMATLFLMGVLEVGLNQVSLASLIIALGMLVDNAIVVSESIMVKMEKGEKPIDAALESTKELFVPLLTSSLTTSAAFMSFYLAENVMGEIMGQLFIVVTVALLCSWLFSMTLVALLCVYFLRIKKKEPNKKTFFDRLIVYYRHMLTWTLKHRKTFITFILLIFFASIYLGRFLPFIFFPDSDRPLITVNFELPLGTRIERTQEGIKEIEQFVAQELLVNKERKEGVESFSSFIGEGAPMYDLGYIPPETLPSSAHVLLNTSSDLANDLVIERVDEFIFNRFPDVTYDVQRLSSGGGSSEDIAVRISGKDPNELARISNLVKNKLRSIKGTRNVHDNWGMRTKKFLIDIHPVKAQLADITNEDIAISLQTVLDGAEVGSFREGEKSIPIMMREERWKTLDVESIDSINVYSQSTGRSVPLKQLADVKTFWQNSKILRRDLYRTITVLSSLKPGFTANEIMQEFKPWMETEKGNWAFGYDYEMGGEAEDSGEAMGAVSDKLPISIFIIILLLIGQFNSVRKPLIVLLTIPLGLIGVILGLLITGSYFGFMAFLGVISLAGIVINNAIVLIDRIKIEKEENNRSDQDSIVFAAEQRFRPILLTTFTTSLGLLPLWFGGGTMWEPMAITIIFGLLFATILTLAFVPVFYSILFRIKY